MRLITTKNELADGEFRGHRRRLARNYRTRRPTNCGLHRHLADVAFQRLNNPTPVSAGVVLFVGAGNPQTDVLGQTGATY